MDKYEILEFVNPTNDLKYRINRDKTYGKNHIPLDLLLKGNISVEDGALQISEIKRLSDGVIFRLGDVVGKYTKGVLSRITIANNNAVLSFTVNSRFVNSVLIENAKNFKHFSSKETEPKMIITSKEKVPLLEVGELIIHNNGSIGMILEIENKIKVLVLSSIKSIVDRDTKKLNNGKIIQEWEKNGVRIWKGSITFTNKVTKRKKLTNSEEEELL